MTTPLSLIPAPTGWWRRLASFDADIFGPDAWSPAVWRSELVQEDRTYVVVTRDPGPIHAMGPILGVGGISHGPEAEIMTLAVAPQERRRGTGTLLLSRLLDIPQAHGAEVVFLEVRVHSVAAQQLYANAGFSIVGRRPNYYSDDDAYIMRLDL